VCNDVYLAVLRLRIKRTRLALGLRQEDVAEKAEMLLRTYQRFEAHASKRHFNPTLSSLCAVAQALSMTVSELTRPATKREIDSLGEVDTRRVWRDGKLV
jgi:transcriptional regulator with XRE-family HTH domain